MSPDSPARAQSHVKTEPKDEPYELANEKVPYLEIMINGSKY